MYRQFISLGGYSAARTLEGFLFEKTEGRLDGLEVEKVFQVVLKTGEVCWGFWK